MYHPWVPFIYGHTIVSFERAEFLSDQLVSGISWNDSLSLGVCIEAPKRLVGAGTSGSSGGGGRGCRGLAGTLLTFVITSRGHLGIVTEAGEGEHGEGMGRCLTGGWEKIGRPSA